MLLTTGNLIVLGICLLFVIVVRRLDRRRLQLQKIKKYSDRIIDDYDKLSESKKRELKDRMIDLDLLVKRAGHIMTNMDKNIAHLDRYLGDVAAQTAVLTELESRLSTAGGMLKDIKGMSVSLEKQDAFLKQSVSKVNYIKEHLTEFEKKLPALEKEMRSRSEEKLDSFLDKALSARIRELRGRLDQIEEGTAALPREIEDALLSAKEKINRELDAVYQEIREKSHQDLAALGEEQERLTERIAGAEKSIGGQLDEVDRRIKAFLNESKLFDRADKLVLKLNKEISGLNQQLEKMKQDKIDVFALRKEIDNFRKEENQVKLLFANLSQSKEELQEMEKRVSGLDSAISDFEMELTTVKDKSVQATRDDFSALNTQLKEIDRKVKAFVKETRLFDRADQLAEKLNGNIVDLSQQINQLKSDKKDLVQFRRDLAEIRKEEDAIKEAYAALSRDKELVFDMEGKLDSMRSSAAQLENKLEDINQARAMFKPVEDRIRELEKLNANLATRMDEVSLKDSKMKRNLERFRRAEDFVEGLDKRMELLKTDLANMENEKRTIGKQVDSLTSQARKMQQNELKISKVLSQFEHMGSMLMDVEQRINQLSLAQERLVKLEDKLRDISTQADIRIEDLSTLSKKIDSFFGVESESYRPRSNTSRSNSGRKPKQSQGADRELNEKIFKMYDTGMDIPQIAKIVKRPISDVELRLHVRKD